MWILIFQQRRVYFFMLMAIDTCAHRHRGKDLGSGSQHRAGSRKRRYHPRAM